MNPVGFSKFLQHHFSLEHVLDEIADTHKRGSQEGLIYSSSVHIADNHKNIMLLVNFFLHARL